MQQFPPENDQVERVKPSDMPPVPVEKPTGGIKQLVMFGIIALIAAFAIVQFYAIPSLVTKKDFTTNITNMVTAIDTVKKDASEAKTAVAQVAAMQSTLNAIQADINSVKAAGSMTQAQVSKLVTDGIAPLNETIKTLQTQISKLPTTSVDSSKLAAIQESIDAVKKDVVALKTGTPTTTTPTTTPASGVTVTGIGDMFGQPYLIYSGGIASNISATRTFNFTVNNNLAKPITSMQFLVAFHALTSDLQQVELPATATVKVASSSMIGTLWQQQPVGGGIYAFTNQVMSGVLSGLGSVGQETGSVQYTMSVTITTADAAVQPINLFPTVKVISFK